MDTAVDVLILAKAEIHGYFPFDPTIDLGTVQVDILTFGTLLPVILQGRLLPQDNAQFER